MVIGAGPAGLEAAVTAANCGHAVTLYEMSRDIGGQLPLVAAPPGRDEFARLMDYYRGQIKPSGVKLKLKKKVNIKTVRKFQPDAVILATGSRQILPDIPGIDRPEVVTAWDALLNKVDLGKTLRRALEKSRNIPAIKVADKVTVSKIHEFADRIGFNAKIDPDLSLSLGSFGVSLKDIVASYAIFPNGGKIVDPKSVISIEDRDGNVYQLDENEKLNKIRLKENYGESDEEEQQIVVSQFFCIYV